MSDDLSLDEQEATRALTALADISLEVPATVNVDITDVTVLAAHVNVLDAMNSAIYQLKQQDRNVVLLCFTLHVHDSDTIQLDYAKCEHLARTTIQKMRSAQQVGTKYITLGNCCDWPRDRCATILLQKNVVDYFRVQTDNL